MRILIIASGYLPYTFSENLCNGKLVLALQAKGWEVDVISRVDTGTNYGSEWVAPWLTLKEHTYEVDYPLGNNIQRAFDLIACSIQMRSIPLNGIRWAQRAYQKALKLHKEKHYDAVLTRSPSDIPHIVGYRFSKKTGVKWLANWNDPADTIWPEPYTHHTSKARHYLTERYTRLCLKNASINTFPSQTLLDHFEENFSFLKKQSTAVIPHIGFADHLLNIKRSSKRDKMYLCHSGNLSAERNPEFTFRAIRELIDEMNIPIRLDIMGHVNEYTKSLIHQFQLEEHVRFIGSFSYTESLARMQEYDVLVLIEAVLKKGIFFPSKFTDYAQSGRPILAISPAVGFAASMLKEQGGGIAVNNADYSDIKKGISLLYQAWKENKLYERYDTQRLFSQFSAKTVTGIYEKLLKQ